MHHSPLYYLWVYGNGYGDKKLWHFLYSWQTILLSNVKSNVVASLSANWAVVTRLDQVMVWGTDNSLDKLSFLLNQWLWCNQNQIFFSHLTVIFEIGATMCLIFPITRQTFSHPWQANSATGSRWHRTYRHICPAKWQFAWCCPFHLLLWRQWSISLHSEHMSVTCILNQVNVNSLQSIFQSCWFI